MVGYINGGDRRQLSFMSIDDMVAQDSSVRAIDAIVDTMGKTTLKFVHSETKTTGRPPHDPVKMFKLYIYCYYEKIRSSRKIKQECGRNIELVWLMEGVVPDHKCIAEFRRQNAEAIKEAFSEFVELCDLLGLVGGDLAAIDGSKFRANNARRKNLTTNKINKKLEHFHKALEAYNHDLEENDAKAEKAGERMKELNALKGEMEERGIREVSLTDPDSRLMETANMGYEVGYNIQNAVDGKHDLILVTEVTNSAADQGQLYPMAAEAARVVGATGEHPLTVLADKGYFEGKGLAKCEADPNITAIVAKSGEKENGCYQKSKFVYDAENDRYTCPQGQSLHRTGKKVREYANRPACRSCAFKEQCTKNKKGRIILRSEHEEAMEAVARRHGEYRELYRRRQMIAEHPFGTIKRTLGFTYFLTRGMDNVRTENHLHMLTYNIKRVLNIFNTQDLIHRLKKIQTMIQENTNPIFVFQHVLIFFR